MLEEHYNLNHPQIVDDGDCDDSVMLVETMLITFKVLSSLLIIAMPAEFPVLLFATIFNWFVT